MHKKAANERFAELRRRALEVLDGYEKTDPEIFNGNIKKLIVELDTNRVELELQNEDLRIAQTEIEISRLNYNELYEFAPVGYLTLDGDCRIVETNRRAAQMLHVPRGQLLNQKLAAFIHFDDQDLFYLHKQQLRDSGQQQSTRLRLKNGKDSPLYVQMESALRREPQDVAGQVLMTMTDITALEKAKTEIAALNKELQRHVRQRTIKLQETQSQLLHSEKLAAIGTLAASIAHELNNPLQGVLNVLKGVRRRVSLDPEDTGLMDIAVDECKRMRNLLKALQDFNRPTSGTRAPLDLHSTLDSVLLLYKKKFATRNIRVEKHYGEHIPILYAIGDQIKQVAMNILANAVDACEGGGIISIRTEADQSCITLIIKDDGIGINPLHQGRIFEPFFSTKSEVKGTGLGLSVSYGIIRHHNGTITVHSTPDNGSEFRIQLPIRGPGRER
jgi:PAS domain S-box-containing protein